MEIRKFQKILVANRGEIALRIFRACYDLNLRTVAIYSQEDMYSLYRTRADEAYLIGENKSPLAAYLDIPGIIDLAKRRNVDAIHPGYGFLSENAAICPRLRRGRYHVYGPSPKILEQMGDKLTAKTIAHECGVPTIPGSARPLTDVETRSHSRRNSAIRCCSRQQEEAAARGMRRCDSAEDFRNKFPAGQERGAEGVPATRISLSRNSLSRPSTSRCRLLGDRYGNIVHLFERDCSLQRRYQKVVELRPRGACRRKSRSRLYADAVKIGGKWAMYPRVQSSSWWTKTGNYYFIEMNPRIQVEHTVTEELTGVDLVRSQILIAEGYPLFDEEIGIRKQVGRGRARLRDAVPASRLRIPRTTLLPDIGKITSYRSSGGQRRAPGRQQYLRRRGDLPVLRFGCSLRSTCHDQTFEGLCRKALRAISEEHIRGVKTNIPFITNILQHPAFQAGKCHTKFIDETPELFDFEEGKDRATKVLRYIAEIQVANPSAERAQYDAPRFPPYENAPPKCEGLKQLLDREGPEAVKNYVLNEKRLLITDTTMRDAHQSLLATRMRTRDMVGAASGTAEILNGCFSLECWGGATFDTAYRFLHESPWERLELLREKIPNIPLQMLLRGSSLVGYSNYPDNLVRAFVKEAAKTGIDVFRVFDSLNWLPGMEIAMDEVLNQGKLCEAAICYTGDILDPKRDKYTLNYYVNLAKEIEKRGAHILCIKDMSGLLKPYAAKKLVTALKSEVGLPIHLHTHDTSGNQVAALLLAAEAGVDIVDTAIDSLSSMTSQPSMNAVVAALHGQDRDTGLDPDKLQKLSDYWADVRLRYASFDGGLKAPSTDIYRYEMPGGQYTNLQSQVEALGLGSQFEDVREMYRQVNLMLGDIIKVTPSSKMVGDLAIFMVQNRLRRKHPRKGRGTDLPGLGGVLLQGHDGPARGRFPARAAKAGAQGREADHLPPGFAA